MHRPKLSFAPFVFLTIWALGAFAQTPAGPDAVWAEFMAWFKAAPAAGNPVMGYVAKLQGDGTPKVEADRQAAIIMDLLPKRDDWIAVYFDKAYARPTTGRPERDGFNAEPSALLVEATQDLAAGTALDAGMGQGRNAVYLARRGWAVTGFDISEGAVAAAQSNARVAGVNITAVRASYEDFDFGRDRWDVIVLAFAWAPVSDPAFVTRLRASLRTCGRVVFEHFVRDEAHPHAGPVRALEPGQLRALFREFSIDRYEEVDGTGDWGGPGVRLVRMVASKKR
jgi:2-polyprenyl-3-methyl-5-hydroxy-6-metoxy-1,4-benzoquinol methylase